MIKVSISYKSKEGGKFDHEYYAGQHLPMVRNLLGEACLKYEVDRGLSGPAPGGEPRIIAACHIYSPSQQAFMAAFSSVQKDILADVQNYTNIAPTMQINEVIEG